MNIPVLSILAVIASPMATASGAEGKPAILRGLVTDEAHAPLAEARILVAIPAADMRFIDAGTTRKLLKDAVDCRVLEARSDAGGNYAVEVPGLSGRTEVSIDAMKPGYRRLSGTLMAGGDARKVGVTPGEPAEAAPLVLKPALYFRGVVVDEQGKPIPSVDINANAVVGGGAGGVELLTSRADGTFEVFNYPPKTDALGKQLGEGPIYFSHPDYLGSHVEDVYALDKTRGESLRVVLPAGRRLSGRVLDDAGKPIAGVMVEASRKDGDGRKATLTDADGRFALRGLVAGISTVTARSLAVHQARSLPVALNGDRRDLELRLRPMALPAGMKSHAVLGMRLADVNPEVQSAYGLFFDRGAVILDPGEGHGRLGLGDLAEGCNFWMVGQKRVGSVREFVDQIVAETAGKDLDAYSVRVVYSFRTVEFVGNNTQYLRLTRDDLKELKALSDRLNPDLE
ncbi:carboxypeptidase-like regulatory domain-containing protein [Aquisphaera giovannonii]|uniref:carboxypeptidase-like regulatory domain-containing protein n=1 Tax=Aquisphaera giovannonii TaxID=406548 RepID=UPI0011DEFF19|nr:carboxypeptidase-like regulatory domain-containing protein [Aquisphaera giovannonii]